MDTAWLTSTRIYGNHWSINGWQVEAHWAPIPDRYKKAELSTHAPIVLKPKKPDMVNSFTQTVGLYYPSDRELQKKRQEEVTLNTVDRNFSVVRL